MSTRTVLALSIAVTFLPVALQGQQRPFTLSPEYAGDIANRAGGPHWGVTVKSFTARLDIRSDNRLSPWVTTGLIVLDANCGMSCPDNGWLLVPGVRIDAVRADPIRAYLIAGAGAAVYNRESIDLLPTAGVGIRWANRGAFVPRLEVRWERYGGDSYAMLGLGFGFVVARPVSAYR